MPGATAVLPEGLSKGFNLLHLIAGVTVPKRQYFLYFCFCQRTHSSTKADLGKRVREVTYTNYRASHQVSLINYFKVGHIY